ncbi:MAG: methyltransferase [Nitrosospira sp.]|nr:methyltransferase [Nitrosospira sp.]
MAGRVRRLLKANLPKTVYEILRVFYPVKNLLEVANFLIDKNLNISFSQKLQILRKSHLISTHVESPHSMQEMLTFISHILKIPKEKKGVIVEAGCYKGGSSAKFSMAASIVGRELVIFDSFMGIPQNSEPQQQTIFGFVTKFAEGSYCGSLEEVKSNIAKFGSISSCRFIEGFFEDTMPSFAEPVCAAYIDVDLVSSTRTCLKYLFPLLEKDCSIYSQDGHLPLVTDLLNDDCFWESEIGISKPRIIGLEKQKLVEIVKR